MIGNLFYSNNNKNAIKSVISSDIDKNLNINNYNVIINETMDYVSSQVSTIPPKGIKTEEYLFLMNKKVYDIVLPIIKSDNNKINSKKKAISNKTNNNKLDITSSDISISNQQINDRNDMNGRNNRNDRNDKKNDSQLVNNIFDPILMRQFENPTIIDYPKPATDKYGIEYTDNKIKNLENERSSLMPKLKPIDFSIKTDNDNKQDTTKLYNELLTNYNSQMDNMNNFEKQQQNINTKIDSITESNILNYNKNQNNYSPIDILQNKNDTKKFFENDKKNVLLTDTSKNVAYNRNDIETFISDDVDDDFINKLNSDNFINNLNKIESFSNESVYENINTLQNNMNDNNVNFNNDVNTYNRSQLLKAEFSSINPHSNAIIIDEPTFDLIEKTFFVLFSSIDRDLYEYPNQTSFQVKFSPAGNNFIFQSYYDEYNTLIISEKNIVFGDATKGSVGQTFDNIKKIVCTSVTVPLKNINSDNFGFHSNVYKEPCLYLVIPELTGPYTGGNLMAYNSFAKLEINYTQNTIIYLNETTGFLQSNFTKLTISSSDEYYSYQQTTAGKLDKMTLQMFNQNGYFYNFGIDKLYVESFSEGSYRYDGYCGNQYLTTKVKIQNKNDQYSNYCSLYNRRSQGPCNLLNSNPIELADLLYFYNTLPNNDQVVFLEDNINITKMKYTKKTNKLEIFVSYKKIINGEEIEIFINFKNIIPGGINNEIDIFKNYIIVIYNSKTNLYYYLTISSFKDNSVIVDYIEAMPLFKDYTNLKIGITKYYLSGYNNDDRNSLFCNNGNYITSIDKTSPDTQWEFEIDFPYLELPEYYKTLYQPGTIFLIQSKMQLNYTFSITTLVKDYASVSSKLNESGSN